MIDFVMISEAGQKGLPTSNNGFTYLRAEEERLTRGSVMYVRNDYIPMTVRVKEPEEDKTGSGKMCGKR